MTPERFALLQDMLNGANFDWTYGDTLWVREPVEFKPRWGKDTNVIDLQSFRKVAFTLRKDVVNLCDQNGFPLTTAHEIAWVEAEGIVVSAWAYDESDAEGEDLADKMIGMACPICLAAKRRRAR